MVADQSAVCKVALENIVFSYEGQQVIHDFNIQVAEHETLVILGPSGCGKTTVLDLIAGFHQPVSGSVDVHGRVRSISQHGSLFPWMTVTENIQVGVKSLPDAQERAREVEALLQLLELKKFEHYYPSQLSGGLKQKVELARALAGESEILLMDEPFSALDYITKARIRTEFANLLKKRRKTVVFVTHDIDDAVILGNRVLILSANPTRIIDELTIDLEQPRSFKHPVIIEARQKIMGLLGLDLIKQ